MGITLVLVTLLAHEPACSVLIPISPLAKLDRSLVPGAQPIPGTAPPKYQSMFPGDLLEWSTILQTATSERFRKEGEFSL